MCAPVFEERKASHRPLVELARAAADAGVTVLRFDYRGCGDSGGVFADYAPNDWLRDIRQACRFLKQHTGTLPLNLFGLRLGASLALDAAAHDPGISGVVLWQPVVKGRDYLQDELRKTLMKQLLTFGGTRVTREYLINKLESGYTVDFDGYSLTPRMYQELGGINLISAAKGLQQPTFIAEFTASGDTTVPVSSLVKVLREMDRDVACVPLKHQPFWNLLGYVDCSGPAEQTMQWMGTRGWASKSVAAETMERSLP